MRRFLEMTKALADENRVRALMQLQGGELCVCQIIEMLGLAPSTVSKHMTILLQAGLVERRKEGRWHYYRLPGPEISPLAQKTMEWMSGSLERCPAVLEDQKRLRGIRKKARQELCQCYRS